MTPRLPDLGAWPRDPADTAGGAARASEAAAGPLPGGRRLQVERDAAGAVTALRSAGALLLRRPRVRGGVATDAAMATIGDAARDDRGWAEETLAVGGATVRSRWLPALDLPALVWEIEGASRTPLAMEWSSAWPSPLAGSSDGSAVAWTAAEGARRLCARAEGGRIAVEGETVRVEREGAGPLRLLLVAAEGDADLERTLQLLERKGIAGLVTQRVQHARLLRDYAASIETPVPALAATFEAAKRMLDDSRADVPGLGRGLAAVQGAGPVAVGDAAAVAGALLAVGSREAARELLQLLAAAQARAGRMPASIDAAGRLGLAAAPAAAARAFVGLAGRYEAWAGGGDLLERLAPAIDLARRAATSDEPSPGESSPAAVGLPRPADPALAGAVARLEEELHGRWGVRPDAAAGGAALRLALPAAWSRAALRRLRIGETVLDLRARRRFGRLAVEVSRAHGPALALTLGVAGPAPTRLTVDDVELGGERATFAVEGGHEVRFEW